MPKPTGKQIKGSVFRGLSQRSGITMAQVAYVEFEPTVGIVAGKIDKLGAAIGDFREPLERSIHEIVMPSIDKNFAVGGRPKWAPRSAATEEIMDRLGIEAGNQVLDRSGELRESMWNMSNWKITDTFAIMDYMPLWYGKLMQEGYGGKGGGKKVGKLREGQTVRGRLEEIVDNAVDGVGTGDRSVSPIPARPFVMLQPEDEDEITELFIEWLGDMVEEHWAGV